MTCPLLKVFRNVAGERSQNSSKFSDDTSLMVERMASKLGLLISIGMRGLKIILTR